jgi:hypothetical protein
MADPVTIGEAMASLARVWADKAEAFRAYAPDDATARVLERCAQELREVVQSTAPSWVTHREIVARTGWSPQWLYRRYHALEVEQRARRTTRGWEVSYAAAMQIPIKAGARSIEGVDDIEELARILGGREAA